MGNVILISLRHLQLEAGVSFDLFHQPTRTLPYLTDCWLLHVRQFCSKFDISLRIQSNRIPQSAREHDSFLMDHALTLQLSRQELVDINLVRIFLQVTTVSDIASACGNHLHQLSWQGKPIPDRKSRSTFARQQSISGGQRGLWRKLLRSLLLPPASNDTLCLLTPLGHWRQESNMIWSNMLWDSNLYRLNPHHRTGNCDVAIHFPQQFLRPDGTASSSTFYDSNPDWYSATVPHFAAPTDVTGCYILHASASSVSFPSLSAEATTFQEWMQQLPEAELRLLSTISLSACDAEQTLLQYLQLECTLYIGTSGGRQNHQGSFSWITCTPGKEQLVVNSGPVDGWHKCQSSLRSAVTAIASVTLYLQEFSNYHSCSIRCKFKFYANSASAVKIVSSIRDQIPTRKFADNADILSTIRAAPEIIHRCLLYHVHRHAEDTTTVFDRLPFAVQLRTLYVMKWPQLTCNVKVETTTRKALNLVPHVRSIYQWKSSLESKTYLRATSHTFEMK